MIPMTDWEPTEPDIAWQKTFIDTLANGAMWGVPATGSAFKFDKENKTFCLTSGDPTHETNRRIAKVLKILGYAETANTGENE